MAGDREGPRGRIHDPGDGRRLPRAPEPRPVPETAKRSLLITRHRADLMPPHPAPSEPAAEPVAAAGYDDHDDGEHQWVGMAPESWPPEPPPIDFQDLDLIRDELNEELPTGFAETPVVHAYRPEPVTSSVAASATGSRKKIIPTGERAQSLARSGHEHLMQSLNPVVPPQSVAGRALMLVVGIMCFLACLSVGALVLVEEAAHDWQLDVSREVTVQVKPVDGKPIEPMLQAAMGIARATSGVRDVKLMTERDSEALLEPWLGTGFDYSKLPVPRLILIELADPANADLKGLANELHVSVPGAELDDHSIWSKRLRTMAGTMVAAGVVVLVLVLTAMVLSVVFATRAAMAGNRDVVQVLHFVGAEDAFVAGEFQHHFLILGFKGGVGGGIAAMLAFLIADWVTQETQGLAGSDQAHALFGGFAVGLNGYLGAAGIVLLVAGLTALTSRLTVRSYLNQLD